MDDRKIEEAVRLFLEGIGEDVNRKGCWRTPARVARMCHQIYAGWADPGEHLLKQFDTANDNMVVEKGYPIYSTCEHHLLPFFGKAHVAYIPNGKVAGLSKLARTVEGFAPPRTDSGKHDGADCGCHGRISEAEGRDGYAGGGASLHDHAGDTEAGNKDRYHDGAGERLQRIFSFSRLSCRW